ncbi:GGDEF domain-containing protein [Alicyclobacillus ferrooxydans]|uniref:GGDEF domain-containing protein n=1 Tax=Alicyclobacillus ferrooxydans TaxID=471514 RepID=UPI0006D5B3E9|nr:GGDEF domain-containing protein [Alicyclobacillus ferrooxydans]
MKTNKLYFWLAIIFLTVLPIGIDHFNAVYHLNAPLVWMIYILPCILVMIAYPSWKATITSGIIFSFIEYTDVITGHRWVNIIGIILIISGSLLYWIIIITMAYFRLRYEELLKDVKQTSYIDPLTGIYNRRYFDSHLQSAVTSNKNQSLILNILDLDYFKRINDTYGHLCGDLALQHICSLIKSNMRETDILSRIGGEEFAVIFSNTSIDEAQQVCERIREAVEKTEFRYKNHPINLTISLGLSQYGGEDFYEFIDKSDKALLTAKQRGRNQLVITY